MHHPSAGPPECRLLDKRRSAFHEIVEKARREGYLVLTQDLGFGELLALGEAEVPSVVVFRLQDMRPIRVRTLPTKR